MKKQANSAHCFVCGVKNPNGLHLSFYETSPGETLAETIVPEQFQGYPGIVHGGIVAAMLDEVSGRVFMTGDPPRFLVTAKLSIRYRRPVPVGKKLTLRGHAKEDNGRVAYAVGEIYDDSGTLLAEAEAHMANVPPGIAANYDASGEEWKVYPDEER